MNQEEKICRPYQTNIRCFPKVPYRYELDGSIDEIRCSLVFPPGYSVYIEEFILENPGPDNFVLLDGDALEYRSKIKWENRQHTNWKNLEKNALNEKYNRRQNYPCVKTLKVT